MIRIQSLVSVPGDTARRLHRLVEPIHLVTYFSGGRKTKEWIESLTDDFAAPAYSSLEPSELDQLIADLGPISAALDAAGSR